MKIRTIQDFLSSLDDELAWRKKELTTLSFLIQQNNKQHNKNLILRAAVPVLYAHWEGFIKRSSSIYLEYVSNQKLKYSQLQENFIAIACHITLKEATVSSQAHIHRQVVDFILLNQSDVARVKFKDVIDTESNLSSKVLINILNTIGIPTSEFWSSSYEIIDKALLKVRNEIAHGEKVSVDLLNYNNMHDFVVSALEYFKTELENSAATSRYKRSN